MARIPGESRGTLRTISGVKRHTGEPVPTGIRRRDINSVERPGAVRRGRPEEGLLIVLEVFVLLCPGFSSSSGLGKGR